MLVWSDLLATLMLTNEIIRGLILEFRIIDVFVVGETFSSEYDMLREFASNRKSISHDTTLCSTSSNITIGTICQHRYRQFGRERQLCTELDWVPGFDFWGERILFILYLRLRLIEA